MGCGASAEPVATAPVEIKSVHFFSPPFLHSLTLGPQKIRPPLPGIQSGMINNYLQAEKTETEKLAELRALIAKQAAEAVAVEIETFRKEALTRQKTIAAAHYDALRSSYLQVRHPPSIFCTE